MLSTFRAIVRAGKIELLEHADLLEGSQVLVTILSDDETQFWLAASETALAAIWDNDEDDVYAALLKA